MRYALLALLAFAVLGLGLFLLSSERDSDVSRVEPAAVELGPREEAPGIEVDSVSGIQDVARTSVQPAAAPAPAVVTADVGMGDEHPFAGAFAGVKGRVVEADGTPAPGLTVTLLHLSADAVLPHQHVPLPLDSIEVSDALTDGEGYFAIGGALGSGFHGLGVDLGGARSTLRFIDESLEYREVLDVGDVRLAEFGTVVGVVIDDDGEPVEGARVRLAAIPDLVTQSGIVEMRSESLLAMAERDTKHVMNPPRWLATLVDRLPVSTAYTNGEGAFRLEGVPAGRVTGGIDRLGSAATVIPGFQLSAGDEHDLDELELLEGRTAAGTVVDAEGEPVEGATIYGGSLQPILQVGFLQPGGVSDAEGKFTVTGVPELGTVMVAARRSATDPWVMEVSEGGSRGMTVRLPGAVDVTVELVDEATGEFLDGASVSARSLGLSQSAGFAGFLDNARRKRPPVKEAAALGSGAYSLPDLALGRWSLLVEVPGYASFSAEFQHEGAPEAHRFALERGVTRDFRLVDAASGEPVANAHAAIISSQGNDTDAPDSTWSDSEGLVHLGPLSTPKVESAGMGMMMASSLFFVVQHPDYGRYCIPLESFEAPSGADEPTEIPLARPVGVSGRVTWAGGIPGARYMLSVVDDNFASTSLPRMAITDAEGHFSLKGIVPGTYDLQLMERFGSRDPLRFLMDIDNMRPIYSRALVVEPGDGDVAVDIELQADGSAKKGWIEGTVRVDGNPVAGASVRLANDPDQQVFTDASGYYRTAELERGGTQLQIGADEFGEPGDESGPLGLHSSWVQVRRGSATVVDVDVSLRKLIVEVVGDEDSKPVAGASVRAPNGSSTKTDEGGIAVLRFVTDRSAPKRQAGFSALATEGALTVRAGGYATESFTEEALVGGADARQEVRLYRAVPCAGRVIFGPDFEGGALEYPWLRIESAEPGLVRDRGTLVNSEARTFEFTDLAPGRYSAQLIVSGVMGQKRVEFEVPPGGNQDLVLDFGAN